MSSVSVTPVHGLTEENLMRSFPIALAGDPSASALGEITARLLARHPDEIDRLRIYSEIDRLDEPVLDILAYDFKVDWWVSDYSLEAKRRTLKDSWRVHKTLGTSAAVKTALRAVCPKADVQEWFKYGGKPYFFKLNIDLTGELSDAARPWRVLERVDFYKSLRSHMDEIIFTFVFPAASLYIGGGAGTQVSTGVPLQPDDLHISEPLRTGGTFASRSSLPVMEDTAQPPTTTILRTGGVCTIISNMSKGD